MNTPSSDPTATERISEVTHLADRTLLAKFFVDPVGVQTAVQTTGLSPAELGFDGHRIIFQAFLRAATEHARTDMDMLIYVLQDGSNRLPDVGGPEYLHDLAHFATQPEIQAKTSAAAVAEVRNLALGRRHRALLARNLQEAENNPTQDFSASANTLVEEIYQGNRRRVFSRGVSSCQGRFRPSAEDLAKRLTNPDQIPAGTFRVGIPKIDLALRGVLRRGRTTLLLGPSGAGKTTTVTQWLTRVALDIRASGKAVAEVYQEGTRQEWIDRAIELHAVNLTGQAPNAESLGRAATELEECRFFVEDGIWQADEIIPYVSHLKEMGVELFVHEAAEHLGTPGDLPSDPRDALDGLEYKLACLKKAAVNNQVAVLMTASVNAFSIPELLGHLRNRQMLCDVAMALLPPNPQDTTVADTNVRTLSVFHSHLGDLGSVGLRLQRNLAGALTAVS